MIRFQLMGDPRGKQRHRTTRTGHTYTPKETLHYEAAIRIAAQDAMEGRAPIDGPCVVEIVATFRPPKSWSKKRTREALAGEVYPTKKPDWDNIAKTTDALNGVAFVDDSQVVEGRVVKQYGEVAALAVTVREV